MHLITVDGVTVEVTRKKVKHLRLTVYPFDGRVRVSAPLLADDETVRQAIVARLAWIRRHLARSSGAWPSSGGAWPSSGGQVVPETHEYVSGEIHDFRGAGHLLNVIEHDGPGKVIRRHGDEADHTYLAPSPLAETRPPVIDLYVRRGSSADRRGAVLTAWYRAELKAQIPPLLAKWQPVIGVEAAAWGVKAMRTRWGSCNSTARRVWINLELAKKAPHLLEYVLVHELVHLLERGHGAAFKAHMDRFLPGWQQMRAELNRAHPVA